MKNKMTDIALSTVYPKIIKKTKNNIFKKIRNLENKKKSKKVPRPKTERNIYTPKVPKVKMFRFTADEAMSEEETEEDEMASDSRNHLTVKRFRPAPTLRPRPALVPRPAARAPRPAAPAPRQRPPPQRAGRRSDSPSADRASILIRPDLTAGGYSIAPLAKRAGTWMLRSPDGTEFHFKSLKNLIKLTNNLIKTNHQAQEELSRNLIS